LFLLHPPSSVFFFFSLFPFLIALRLRSHGSHCGYASKHFRDLVVFLFMPPLSPPILLLLGPPRLQFFVVFWSIVHRSLSVRSIVR
jgi:hypothetical protein